MTFDEALKFATHPGITFVVGGICGFVATRLTMTASERSQHRQRIYENSVRRKKEKEERYLAFVNAITSYCNKAEKPTLDDFQSIATSGDMYFNELKIIADSILSGHIDRNSRDHTFVPAIAEALQKNIPQYYDTLSKISARVGAPYDGRFKRTNYESLFRVVERFASNSVLPPASL
jgi:hypothetical protein